MARVELRATRVVAHRYCTKGNSETLLALPLRTIEDRSVLAFKLVAIDKGTPPSVEFPVPYLEVRDRESPCRCSAVSFFVCCPGMPRAELTPLRQKRSRAVRRGL